MMSIKANPTLIGGFVVGAMLVAVAALITLGSGKFFEESTKYILYFEGDLGGLDVGAPVTYRGVNIGQVSEISLIYDHTSGNLSIPVIIEIMKDAVIEENLAETHHKENQTQRLIDLGMRARLATSSLVTGKLKIDLDHYPDTEIVYRAKGHPLEEIPTIPGALDSLAKRFNELPLEEIVVDLGDSIHAISQFMHSGSLGETVDKLNLAIKNISTLLSSSELQGALSGLEGTLQETQAVIHEFREGSKPVRRELTLAIEEFSDAARTAQSFLDYIERHPESLIRGKEEK